MTTSKKKKNPTFSKAEMKSTTTPSNERNIKIDTDRKFKRAHTVHTTVFFFLFITFYMDLQSEKNDANRLDAPTNATRMTRSAEPNDLLG